MLLAVDKPTWISTFDIIRRLHKSLPKIKMWHCGTLDPLATGLVLIWTEKDTKLMTQLVWLDKKYITTIDFSKISDTWDIDYREYYEDYIYSLTWDDVTINIDWVPSSHNISIIYTQIIKLLDWIVWSHELPLPTFSAKKVKWQKLYELARKWIDAQETRIMKIYNYKIINWSFPKLELEISVWSGTYIRSIAYWLWKQLWLGGILTSLRRTQIGKLDITKIDTKKDELSDLYIQSVNLEEII